MTKDEDRAIVDRALKVLAQLSDSVEQEPDDWVLRITHDRRIDVNENVKVTEAAQKVLTVLQSMLVSQPEQEPVAKYIGESYDGSLVQFYDDVKIGTKLYTYPPKRQPLTLKQQQEIEIDMTINQGFAGVNIGYLIGLVIKATEAAHDIKETP